MAKIKDLLWVASIIPILLAVPTPAQEFVHSRRIPHRPDRPSSRDVITAKFERRDEILTEMLKQHQSIIDQHESGRKLLKDEEISLHRQHIKSMKRKLSVHRSKDPKIIELEIENEIALYQKMMEGEFLWTSKGLILKATSTA